MLDAAFQSDTDLVLNDMAQRPRPPKPREPAFSVWGVVRGAGRSVPAGAAEVIGSAAEVLGGFGQVLASTGTVSSRGIFALQTEEERRESERQAKRIREEGVDFRSDAGQLFRGVAREYMPDPVTAHGAEVAVAQFGRLATKAVGAALTLGPVAGAAVVGAEEGFTEAEKLAAEGVDARTRMQAGAVTGVLTGLGLALPVAGQTVKGTVGLALAGGPASFVGQQAATRAILDNAGYDKLADQYDPFDPVGLTLSTLLPLGFGALAMRGAARARAAAASERNASKEGAKPEVAPAPAADVPPSARTAVAQAVDEISVDSARVNLLREHIETTRLTPAEDMRGATQHREALARALDQVAGGSRVDVSDLAPEATDKLQEAITLIRDRFVNTARGVTEAVLASADQVRQFVLGPALDKLDNSSKVNFSQITEAVAARILDQTGVDIMVGARQELRADAVRHSLKGHPNLTPDDWAALPWLAENFDRATLLKPERGDSGPRIALSATDPVSGAAYVAEFNTGGRKAGQRLRLVTYFKDHPNTIRSYLDTNGQGGKGVEGGGTPDAPLLPKSPEALTSDTVPGDGAIVSKPADQRTPEAPGGAAVESPAVDAAARELEATNPDLMVQLDGMDQPVRLADLLAQTRQQLADDLAEVPLIETAAACFIRSGTL